MTEARDITRPEIGYWAVRLVRGGPAIGAAITCVQTTSEPGEFGNRMERSPFLIGMLGGKIVTPNEIWERRGKPITAAEYAYLIESQEWDTANAPDAPLANPHQPIDLNQQRAVYPPGRKAP